MGERPQLIDYEALYGALNSARQERQMSWRDVAAAVQTSPSTFTRVAQQKGIDASTFGALVSWLGVDAGQFIAGAPNKSKRRTQEGGSTLAAISGHLRADKHLDAEGARHMESIISSAYRALTAEKAKRRVSRIQGPS